MGGTLKRVRILAEKKEKKGKKREWEYQHMSECRKESHYLYNKGKKIKTEPRNRLYTQMDLGLTTNQCSN